jgi:hypothetical protein
MRHSLAPAVVTATKPTICRGGLWPHVPLTFSAAPHITLQQPGFRPDPAAQPSMAAQAAPAAPVPATAQGAAQVEQQLSPALAAPFRPRLGHKMPAFRSIWRPSGSQIDQELSLGSLNQAGLSFRVAEGRRIGTGTDWNGACRQADAVAMRGMSCSAGSSGTGINAC